MDPVVLAAFEDEMSKIAGLKELWQKVVDFFRPQDDRVKHRVDFFFSPKTGDEKWDRLPSYARDQKFVDAISQSPFADSKLKSHVQALHDLSHGKPIARISSSKTPGKTYEVRKMQDGSLGCMCNDWRFKGSVSSSYECKHIQAYRAGKSKAA